MPMQLYIQHTSGRNSSGPIVSAMQFEEGGPHITDPLKAAQTLAKKLFEDREFPLILSDSVGGYQIFSEEYINQSIVYVVNLEQQKEEQPVREPKKPEYPVGEMITGVGAPVTPESPAPVQESQGFRGITEPTEQETG